MYGAHHRAIQELLIYECTYPATLTKTTQWNTMISETYRHSVASERACVVSNKLPAGKKCVSPRKIILDLLLIYRCLRVESSCKHIPGSLHRKLLYVYQHCDSHELSTYRAIIPPRSKQSLGPGKIYAVIRRCNACHVRCLDFGRL
jgi:hypothetical protein